MLSRLCDSQHLFLDHFAQRENFAMEIRDLETDLRKVWFPCQHIVHDSLMRTQDVVAGFVLHSAGLVSDRAGTGPS